MTPPLGAARTLPRFGPRGQYDVTDEQAQRLGRQPARYSIKGFVPTRFWS